MKLIVVCGRAGYGKSTVAEMVESEQGALQIAVADEIKRTGIEVFPTLLNAENCFGPSECRERKVVVTPEVLVEALRRLPHTNACKFIVRTKEWRDETFEGANRAIQERFRCVFVEHVGTPVSIRWILQRLGSEWGRSLLPTMWLDMLFGTMLHLSEPPREWLLESYSASMGIHTLKDRFGVPSRKFVVSDVRLPMEIEYLRERVPEMQVLWVDGSKRIPPSGDTHETEPDDAFVANARATVIDNNGSIDDLRDRVRAVLPEREVFDDIDSMYSSVMVMDDLLNTVESALPKPLVTAVRVGMKSAHEMTVRLHKSCETEPSLRHDAEYIGAHYAAAEALLQPLLLRLAAATQEAIERQDREAKGTKQEGNEAGIESPPTT